MLTTIAGIIWIILGAGLLWRPQAVTRRIEKKGRKAFTRVLLVIGVSIIGALCSFAFEYAGWLPKLIALAGMIIVIKLFLVARSKFGKHLAEHTKHLTLTHLRLIAVSYLVLGVCLLSMSRVANALGIGQKENPPEQAESAEAGATSRQQPEKKNNDENDRLPRTLRHR
jgi:hypothetical protein